MFRFFLRASVTELHNISRFRRTLVFVGVVFVGGSSGFPVVSLQLDLSFSLSALCGRRESRRMTLNGLEPSRLKKLTRPGRHENMPTFGGFFVCFFLFFFLLSNGTKTEECWGRRRGCEGQPGARMKEEEYRSSTGSHVTSHRKLNSSPWNLLQTARTSALLKEKNVEKKKQIYAFLLCVHLEISLQ